METFKHALDRYTSIAVVITAIANVLKFIVNRDAAALYTVAVIGAVTFTMLVVYMKYFAQIVNPAIVKFFKTSS
jgi:hypothetical protein